MELTGATFNFNKTVSEGDSPSSPEKPTDGAKLEKGIAGEKKGNQNTKDFINLSIVKQTLSTTTNNAIQSVEGSRLSAQVGALQSIANTAISSVFMAATNPYALVASLACKGISFAFQQDQYNREKTWSDYDIEEYKERRGYSSKRTRSNG